MKVKAIRTDSWLGIKEGEIYKTKVYKGDFGERIWVMTDGFEVPFKKDDFVIENGGSTGTVFV